MLASDFLGRTAHDAAGRELGRVADLVADPDGRVVAVLVVPPRHRRLLGYDRPGSWLPLAIRWLARRQRSGSHRVEWSDVRWTAD